MQNQMQHCFTSTLNKSSSEISEVKLNVFQAMKRKQNSFYSWMCLFPICTHMFRQWWHCNMKDSDSKIGFYYFYTVIQSNTFNYITKSTLEVCYTYLNQCCQSTIGNSIRFFLSIDSQGALMCTNFQGQYGRSLAPPLFIFTICKIIWWTGLLTKIEA